MLSKLLALEEINVAPRRREELVVSNIDVEKLLEEGLIKQESQFFYLTEKGLRELSKLYGILDTLQTIYMNMAFNRETRKEEIEEDVLKDLLSSGLIEIKEDVIILTFDGIRLVAQRIVEKMSRAH
ncbi:hypothetical protein [Metallosphaera javensis (ex Sakai et al. 2022)]|uniref:hypothetical protein n=1 Tax=Metallosphaera javensis (ex Sakai et al. 2022) TaxID=2775498 RepID=UPI0025831A51|nr:MAG: hypothetical protein MjAS7_1757 [Metallosphaera javensis (ex Sakai et al. 2022)]